jgi:hypothetical protein
LVVEWLRQLKKPPDAGRRKRLGECRNVALAYMRSRRKSVKRLLTPVRIRRSPPHFKAGANIDAESGGEESHAEP